MKVVILGNGEMLSNLIEGVIDAEFDVVGVLRHERVDLPFWKLFFKDIFNPSKELTLIKQYNLYDINCNSANSEKFKNEFLKLNADVLLVGSWSEKLKREIFNLPVIAAINVHPSYLPRYRGPNPYLQSILHLEKFSGVTFHLINENFDEGAILSQKQIQILPHDTSKELKQRTVFQARLMCAELLKKLEYGLIIPLKQNENCSSYYKNITDNDKMLNFKCESAEKICARIRALHPWLPCYVTYKNKFFIPDPYKLMIIDKPVTSKSAGEIIDTDYKLNSITVLACDNKAVRMTNVKLYGFFNRPFTSQYIKHIKI